MEASKKLSGIDKHVNKLGKLSKRIRVLAQSDQVDVEQLKKLDVVLSKTIAQLVSNLHVERVAADTMLSIIKQEIKEDLVDRDANDAKSLDKQRIAAERGEKYASTLLKSYESVSNINHELSQACPWHKTRICKSVSAFEISQD